MIIRRLVIQTQVRPFSIFTFFIQVTFPPPVNHEIETLTDECQKNPLTLHTLHFIDSLNLPSTGGVYFPYSLNLAREVLFCLYLPSELNMAMINPVQVSRYFTEDT